MCMNPDFLFLPVGPQHREAVGGGARLLLLLLIARQRHHQRALRQPAAPRLRAGARLGAHPQQQEGPSELPVAAAQSTGESREGAGPLRRPLAHLFILLRSTYAVGITPSAAPTSPCRPSVARRWIWTTWWRRWRGRSFCDRRNDPRWRRCTLTCSRRWGWRSP